MIQIIPAIDIIDGCCVRLTKGDYSQKKVYNASPLDMVLSFQDCGVKRIHMVDLNGAKVSRPVNLKVMEQIRKWTDSEIEWGGGISSDKALKSCIDAGVSQAIVGSVAVLNPEKFSDWLFLYGPDRIILGADISEGHLAIKGWQEGTAITVDDILNKFVPEGLTQCICTDISRDGMLQGVDALYYEQLQRRFESVVFTVSGGISSMKDIVALDEKGLQRVIVGKAIYENRITLEDIKKWSQNA